MSRGGRDRRDDPRTIDRRGMHCPADVLADIACEFMRGYETAAQAARRCAGWSEAALLSPEDRQCLLDAEKLFRDDRGAEAADLLAR